MRRSRVGILGALLVALSTAMASCSDGNDDDIGNACKVIVRDCHVGDMGTCIDAVGNLPLECIQCIEMSGCDYHSCDTVPAGCRLPPELIKQ